jgi:hypothetical protein
MQQCAFARSGCAHNCYGFAAADLEIHASQHWHCVRALAENLMQVRAGNYGLSSHGDEAWNVTT